jgi:hypothetical protein
MHSCVFRKQLADLFDILFYASRLLIEGSRYRTMPWIDFISQSTVVILAGQVYGSIRFRSIGQKSKRFSLALIV